MSSLSKILNALFFILNNLKYFHFSSPKKNKLLIADTITIDHLKKYIIFDSGMYDGNNRNYSMFRSSYNKFWRNLIIVED